MQQFAILRDEDWLRLAFGVHATAATKELYSCFCFVRLDQKYKWLPDNCDALMYAVYGRATLRRTPEPYVCERIRERFNFGIWSELRTRLESEHGKLTATATFGGRLLSGTSNITA